MKSRRERLAEGVAWHRAGDLAAAEAVYERLLAESPSDAAPWHMLGLVAQQRGDPALAVQRIGRALELNPGEPHYHNNLGVACRALGDLERAVGCYRQAVRLRPEYADAWSNLAVALHEQGLTAAAQDGFARALELCPDHADAHFNLANLLAAEQLPQAIAHYRRALQARPQWPEALNNLGNALLAGDCPAEAAEAYEQALTSRPDYAEALNNLGLAHKRQGRVADALASWSRAGRLRPDRTLWQFRLRTLCPPIFFNNQEIDDYRGQLAQTLQSYRDRPLEFDLDDIPHSGAEPPYELFFQGRDDRRLKEAYAGIFAHAARGVNRPPLDNRHKEKRRGGKPRIAFVVTQSHEGIFIRWMAGLIDLLDRSQLDVTVVCAPAGRARLAAALTNTQTGFLVLPPRFSDMVACLRAASFDLIHYWEVGSDAVNYFLPRFRLARLQTTSFGVQVTSGLREVDYYLSCDAIEPPAAEGHYTERLLRVPGLPTYQVRQRFFSQPYDRSHFGLPATGCLYFCGQQLRKFHPDFDALLAGVLQRDPSGRIVLLAECSAFITEQLQRRLSISLGDLAERVTFVPRQELHGYFSLIALCDVLLDTPHFGGATTAYDAFSFQKPVVTLPGAFQRSRYTLACYGRMGLSACIAQTPDEYIGQAWQLGTNRDYRDSVAAELRVRSDVLFEDRQAVTNLQETWLGLM